MAKYRVGDKVKIVDKWVDAFIVNWEGLMDKWLGKTMTIRQVNTINDTYFMEEDKDENFGTGWAWVEENIECRVDDAPNATTTKFKVGDKVKVISNGGKVTLDNGYTENIEHYFEIGTIVTVVSNDYEDKVYRCEDDSGLRQYVATCDLALVTDSNDTNTTNTANDTPKDDCYFEIDGFKYGDKVKVLDSGCCCPEAKGKIGTVIAYDTNWGMVGVEFDTTLSFPANRCGDRTHGRSGKDCSCLWFLKPMVEIISTTPTNTTEYYNGKVVCVEVRHFGYTVGKIYQFKDGQITDDKGDCYPTLTPPIKSFKEWCDWTTSKFIEIVD